WAGRRCGPAGGGPGRPPRGPLTHRLHGVLSAYWLYTISPKLWVLILNGISHNEIMGRGGNIRILVLFLAGLGVALGTGGCGNGQPYFQQTGNDFSDFGGG